MTDFTDTTNDEDVVDDTEETEDDGNTFKIKVNGEVVWESEGDAMLVDRVNVYRAAGEVTAIGSPGTDQWLSIEVNERSYDAPETYLDMIETRQANERREQFEPGIPGSEREGYVEADPETGEPMNQEDDDNKEEEVEVQSQEDQEQEKAAVGDVEF